MTLSSSPLLLAETAKLMSGVGKLDRREAAGEALVLSVSPVTTSLSLAMAPMSPATRLSLCLFSLPMVLRSWPNRSL